MAFFQYSKYGTYLTLRHEPISHSADEGDDYFLARCFQVSTGLTDAVLTLPRNRRGDNRR